MMNSQGSQTLNSSTVWLPDGIEEAWKIKQEYRQDACFIAGGTLLQTNWKKGNPRPAHLISLERIKDLQRFDKLQNVDQTEIVLGTLTTLHFCRKHSDIQEHVPLLTEAAKNIAAPAIRNRGTIGGNIMNGCGDTLPALLAMEACVSVFNGSDLQTELLWDFLRKRNAESDSILIYIRLPQMADTEDSFCFYKKIGYREAFSPSIVTVSGYGRISGEGKIEEIRLAAGSGDTPSQRLVACEEQLKGISIYQKNWGKIHSSITGEFQPHSAIFASAEYKQFIAANIIVSELTKLAG